jgi:hypothetical protein
MGKVEINQNKTQHLLTPEMLPSYRQLLLVNNMKELLKSLPRQTGLLSFNYICPLITIYNQEILLGNRNVNEGARDL